jgi:hypothetical protein
MKLQMNRSTLSHLFLMAMLPLLCAGAHSQSPDQPAAIRPKREAAQAGPAKPWTPVFTPDGQPDWQGFWRANPGGDSYDITGGKPRPDFNLQGNGTPKPGIDRVSGTPDGQIPYQPWAAAKRQDILHNVDDPTKPEYVDTQAHCLLEGPGRVFIHSGFEIIQTPGYIVFLTEQNDEQVIVPLDGRPHVGAGIALWQGDRRGHWEGNTLVVDVTNVKGKSRLDMVGDFYSHSAHFVERFTRVDENTIQYEATVTDPAVYTQPWTLNIRLRRSHGDDPHYELWEDACHEGERSADRLVISPDAAKANSLAAAKAAAAAKTEAAGAVATQR